MNLLQQFVDFLINQKSIPSSLTVKNYKADIGQFVSWFEEEFKSPFDPLKITLQVFEKYKAVRNLSRRSIERHASSLRKFFKFLNLKGIMPQNPLEKKTSSAETQVLTDPYMIRGFKNFLYEFKKSNLTIKNYINDIRSFFLWFGEVALIKYAWNVADKNLLSKINSSIVEEYKNRLIAAKFSPLTINRKLSSLRNYIAWAKSQGLIASDPTPYHPAFISGSNIAVNRPAPEQEIPKSVRDDKEDYSSFPPIRLMQKGLRGINLIFDTFFILPIAETIEYMQYLFWQATGRRIFAKNTKRFGFQSQDDIARISNIKKEFYAPLNVSTRYLQAHKRIWHYIRHVRPNWYKKYHSYSFTHYFHFAILTILSSVIGFGVYNSFFAQAQKENAILGAATSAPPRILSFQGKLTDSADSAITRETNILFSLYDDEDASSEAALWQENNTVKPDSDGVFSAFLGKKTPILDTVFSQNSKLFLGITVGDSPELRPRQEMATVPFASNAETLQGLEPITNTTKTSNVVLALDSSGNLSIAGSKTHTFQVIGGKFVLSGKILSLTTIPGSNSNIEIAPNGIGKIDLSKPILNSTNNNNLTSAVGSVEFDDTVAILATTSAQAALYINQNSTGALISASTSGTAKFVVENDGTGKFTGDLTVNGGDLTSSATTFNLLNSTVTTLNFAGAATNLILGATTGTITIRNASAAIQGNITLGDATTDTITFTGRVAQDSDLVPIGTTGTNDLGSSSLPWDNAYISNLYTSSTGTFGYWQRNAQALSPTNASDDILIGAIATPSASIKLSGTSGNNSWINTGNVGIGTTTPLFRFDVQDSQSSTAAAQIFNTNTGTDADGLVLKLGNTSTSAVAASNHFINFETAGIGIVGSIQGNGGKGVTYATSGIADFAEYFKKDKNQTIEYGSVVCLSNNGLAVKCDRDDNHKIIGVASERPAFLGGENLGTGSIAIGLIGQVETFATVRNGAIKTGDMLTVSDIPGVAVKATKTGSIIGKALEDLSTIDESRVAGFYDPDNKEFRSKDSFPDIPLKPNIVRVVKIYALVNVSWYDPKTYLAQDGSLIINNTDSNGYSISNSNNETLTTIGGFFEVIAANIKSGLINASEVITNTLVVTSDSLIVNGQNLRSYIAGVIDELGITNHEPGVVSPVVKTDRLATNIISPLADDSDISVSLHDSQFTIHNSANASGSAVARIDDQGNASFSGTLNSQSLETADARVRGTLRANNIIADSITGLEAKISNIYSTNFMDLASYSAQLSYVPDLTAERGQFRQGLMVFGPASLSDLALAGRLSIGGTMFVTENSLETLGTDLSLQSLRQGGLSIMGGLVYVDTEGNVKIQGDLSVAGRLAVNIISPLPTSDLVVNNASGSSVLSINQTGDVAASGSGTFSKLNLSFVAPVVAVSATEVIASSSAGIANIAPYQSEIIIKNALVTNRSVIYITPVGTPSAQTPFLMRQIPNGSFTVGVQSPTNRPIEFNWLIIN